jgi:hypothetical protein
VTDSPEQYWDVMSEHVSVAAAALRQADDDARRRIRARVVEAVSGFARDGAVRVPGLARCILGTRS